MAPPTAHMRSATLGRCALPAQSRDTKNRSDGYDDVVVLTAPQRDREAACCAAATGPPLTESDGCYQSSCRNSSAPGAAS